MKKTILLFTLILLTGCQTLGLRRSVSEQDVQNARSVGVYSNMGSSLQHVFAGTTIFNNEHQTISLPQWQMDSFVESNMLSAVNQSTASRSAGIIQRNDQPRPAIDGKAGINVLLDVARTQGYDTALIALPADYDNAPHLRPGYGLFKKSTFGIPYSCIYAQYTVYAYDTRTKEDLGWQWGFDSWSEGPCTEMPVPWKDSFASYSEHEKKIIESSIKTKIANGLKGAISKLGFAK